MEGISGRKRRGFSRTYNCNRSWLGRAGLRETIRKSRRFDSARRQRCQRVDLRRMIREENARNIAKKMIRRFSEAGCGVVKRPALQQSDRRKSVDWVGTTPKRGYL